MISNKDLTSINTLLETNKALMNSDIKSKNTIALENGNKATIYNMGKTQKTIRIDIKVAD